MSGYDFDRPYVAYDKLMTYAAIDANTAQKYGDTVRAIQMSNSEYNTRFNRLARENNMKPPPSIGRKFSGYLVVRRPGTNAQYETWMPADVFEELYRAAPDADRSGR